MWLPLSFIVILAIIAFAASVKASRSRRRERGIVLAEIRSFARGAEDPALRGEMRFSKPLRSDDREHDTIFTVRHGSHGLSLSLDTSRWRIRWWALAEWFAPDGSRSARFEATFVESAIPTPDIQVLLKAARGDLPAAPAAEAPAPSPSPPPDPPVDPFDGPDPAAQA